MASLVSSSHNASQFKFLPCHWGLRPSSARFRPMLVLSQRSLGHSVCRKFSYSFEMKRRLIAKNMGKTTFIGEESGPQYDLDVEGEELFGGDVDDHGTPWEGAIVYKRNPSISHFEFCTTLERLGLGKLSTEISRIRSSLMGLRITKGSVNDCGDGTPVLVSFDVTRKKQKLRLDGIIRTIITLGCNRCGGQAAESVFSNFSLLLSEEPIEEQVRINLGAIFGGEKFGTSMDTEEEDDASIDIDDQLYFPPEEDAIDISKHIRDLIHVEITINALCDPMCKGLCLRCGTNLNVGRCSCNANEADEKQYGPLGSLRKQMQQN